MDQVEVITNKVSELEHLDKIIFQVGDNDYRVANLEEFCKQGIDGILYDLNRLEEVLITLAKSDQNRIPYLVNDLGLVKFTRYLYSEYLRLKSKSEQGYNKTNID